MAFICFRVWNREEQEYITQRSDIFLKQTGELFKPVGSNRVMFPIATYKFDVELRLNLFDIHGCQVYAGDVVKVYKEGCAEPLPVLRVVIYDGVTHWLKAVPENYSPMDISDDISLEIVGNIHEEKYQND